MNRFTRFAVFFLTILTLALGASAPALADDFCSRPHPSGCRHDTHDCHHADGHGHRCYNSGGWNYDRRDDDRHYGRRNNRSGFGDTTGVAAAAAAALGIGISSIENGVTKRHLSNNELKALEAKARILEAQAKLAEANAKIAMAEAEAAAKKAVRASNPYRYYIVNNAPRTMEVTITMPGKEDEIVVMPPGKSIPLPEIPEGTSVFDVSASGVAVNPLGLPGSSIGTFYRGRVQASGCPEGLCFTPLCLAVQTAEGEK